jgi:hypothetical protein
VTTLHIWRTIDDDKPPSPIYTYNAQDFFTKLKRTSMEWNKYTDSSATTARRRKKTGEELVLPNLKIFFVKVRSVNYTFSRTESKFGIFSTYLEYTNRINGRRQEGDPVGDAFEVAWNWNGKAYI